MCERGGGGGTGVCCEGGLIVWGRVMEGESVWQVVTEMQSPAKGGLLKAHMNENEQTNKHCCR